MATVHPKVAAHLGVGVALTIATIVAHALAAQNAVPWVATYAALAVTGLGLLAGYLTPSTAVPVAQPGTAVRLVPRLAPIESPPGPVGGP